MQGIHSLLALLADSSSLVERRGEAMEDRRGNRATLDHKKAIEIVDFPKKNGGSLHSYGTIYQSVTQWDDAD